MSIINNSYFINDLLLPIESINIQSYIEQYEFEILEKILGYNLAKDFVDGLAAATPLTKWTDLRDGVEYTLSVLKKYKGIKNIISRYIFVKILTDMQSFTTLNGVKFGNSENATSHEPRSKQVNAYNSMIDFITEMNEFINVNILDYDNFISSSLTKANVFSL